jgi:hypothetical protein
MGELSGPRYFGELRSIIEQNDDSMFEEIMKGVSPAALSDVKGIARTSYFYTGCETAEKVLRYLSDEDA